MFSRTAVISLYIQSIESIDLFDVSLNSINEYAESMLFCCLEELSYVVSESAASLLSHFNIKLPITDRTVKYTNTVEMVEAIVTGVSDDEANVVTIRIEKNTEMTQYKWNEAVVLITSADLSEKSQSILPTMGFGIINNSNDPMNAKKEEWTLFVNTTQELKPYLSLHSRIYLYSISTFTSSLR